MTVKELQLLVKEGEHSTLEFKRKVAHPEKIMKEIVAFANTQGGNLLIGVNDDGNLSGLKFPDEEAYVLEKAMHELCRPRVDFRKEYIKLSEKKSIIRYYIPESPQKPHYVQEPVALNGHQQGKSLQKRSYFRLKDRSIQASRELREIIRRRRNPKDIHFIWGDKEKLLLEFLHEHKSITVKAFARLAGIRPYQASHTLVKLVLGNVLNIIPAEGEDLYVTRETAP